MTEPRTKAGRALLAKLETVNASRYATVSFPFADEDILAIEAEAVTPSPAPSDGLPDYEQMRRDRGWPTPNHMRRIAGAIDEFTPAKYGDVLRWVADLCDAALLCTLATEDECATPSPAPSDGLRAAYFDADVTKRIAATIHEARGHTGGIDEFCQSFARGCAEDFAALSAPVQGLDVERLTEAIGATLDLFSAAITNSSGQISWSVFAQELAARLSEQSR